MNLTDHIIFESLECCTCEYKQYSIRDAASEAKMDCPKCYATNTMYTCITAWDMTQETKDEIPYRPLMRNEPESLMAEYQDMINDALDARNPYEQPEFGDEIDFMDEIPD